MAGSSVPELGGSPVDRGWHPDRVWASIADRLLAYRKRAIPIAWMWGKQAKGYSSAIKQLALLAYVHSLMPVGVAVSLTGECEFGSIAVLCKLDR